MSYELRITEHTRDFLVLLAVSVPALFWGIGSVSFLDPDEGMYGDIARGMAIGGDWIRRPSCHTKRTDPKAGSADHNRIAHSDGPNNFMVSPPNQK